MSSPVPAASGLNVNPSDTNLEQPCRAIYVGGAGNLVLTGLNGVDYTLTGCLAGMIYPVQARRIRAASTATNLVVLF